MQEDIQKISAVSASGTPYEKNRKLRNQIKPRLSVLTTILLAILIVYSISLFIPLLWGVLTSLKHYTEFRKNVFGLPQGWPWEWEWANYSYAFSKFFVKVTEGAGFRSVYLEEMFLYSVLYAVGCAFFQTLVCCIVAYAAARFNYFFSKVLYAVVIVAMVLPIVGNLPSEIQMAKTLGIFDKIWGLWIMKSHFLGMYFLVFHAMFKGMPKDFADAARVDGAGNLQVLVSIMLPMVMGTFGTVMLLNFIVYWNDYQVPLIYMEHFPTVAVGLYHYSNSTDRVLSRIPLQLTGCMIMTIPILIVFLIFRNRLIGNISMGGLKE